MKLYSFSGSCGLASHIVLNWIGEPFEVKLMQKEETKSPEYLKLNPMGKVLAGPLWDEEGIVSAEIDLGLISESMFDFDPVGHYSRPDVFQLSVDTRPRQAVWLEQEPDPGVAD